MSPRDTNVWHELPALVALGGGVAFALGGAGLAGRALPTGAWFAPLLPHWLAAVCLMLAGVALLLPANRTRAPRTLGLAVVALGTAAMAGSVFNLTFLASAITPNAAMAFVFFGAAQALAPGVAAPWRANLVQLFSTSALALGFIDLATLLLRFDVPGWYEQARMAPLTAAGVIVLTFGLWQQASRGEAQQRLQVGQEDRRIVQIGGVIMLFLVLSAGLLGFGLMSATTEEVLTDSLRVSLDNRLRVARTGIEQALAAAHLIAQRPRLNVLMEQHARASLTDSEREEIGRILDNIVQTTGVTAVQLTDAHRRPVGGRGNLVTQAQLWAPLRVKPEAALYWRQGTGLFVHQPMAKGKPAAGTVAVNIPLAAIDALLEDHTGLGASGAMGLCAPLPGHHMQCLPNRANQHQVMKRSRLLDQQPVPMSHALDGKQGIVRSPDSQGQMVIAAYAPIGEYGLGLVARARTADLYQPIHMQLRYMLLWLLALVFGGLVLLRWQLAPLVRRLVHEVHERRVAEGRLQHLAHHDVLTGLPNRALQHAHLQQAMAEANRLNRLAAVMFLDLDRFKVINDTLGHGVGDALLKEVALRLGDSIRPGDTVARVGGDEFTVILGTLAHLDDATLVARKILARFNDPFRVDGRELFVSPSIGITLYPHDGDDADTLLRNADAAMYHAKESGRNTFRFFTPALNERASRRFALETALHQALARDEFVLHYQPLVNMATGRIRGVEALLRWRHPETGLVPPLEFIPVAEETGLIAPIGDWVLRTACAQMRAWHAAGHPPLHVSVNLSGKQMNPDLPRKIRDILDATGLAPEYLDLEITESILFQDVEETVAVMQELHAMGISLSLDDFGTGYSSLSYLRRLPIRYLKIDRSFVRDILDDPNDAAIVSAIIAMARALNLEVVAEGVESYEQLKFLRAQGCDITQGYFCSKPLDTGELTELLEVWKSLNQGKCRALGGDNRGKAARGRNGAGARRRPPATKSR